MTGKTVGRSGENYVFRALYLLAIIFVVDGHCMLDHMFAMGDLFKYYSFHLMLFAFGSGYFFHMREGFLPDLAARAKRLLIPLYVWNVVYGVGAMVLRRFGGFEIGQQISAYTLLLAPLVDGEHFVWNLGAWFIFPLFLAQTLYGLMRRAARLWKDREGITFLICLALGSAAVEMCRAGRQDMLPLFLMRTIILLPGYAAGQLYRRELERRDTMKTVPYLIIVLIARALLCVRYGNLAYLLSSCTYFDCGAFGVYAGGALAIAFYLRIARLIAPLVQKSRLALFASRHTFDIMMHHVMGYFSLNCVFLVFNALGIAAADFSVRSMRTQYDYCYSPGMRSEWNILYLLAGMLVPMAIAWVVEQGKRAILTLKRREAK